MVLTKFIYNKIYPGNWLTFFSLLSQTTHQVESKRIFLALKSKQELVKVTHQHILIGDLIYDTYLCPTNTFSVRQIFRANISKPKRK